MIPRGMKQWRTIFAALSAVCALVASIQSCAAARLPINPRPGPDRTHVVGRLEIFRAGTKVSLADADLGRVLGRAERTELLLRDLATEERFEISIADPGGWFAATLRPGTYDLSMRHSIWFVGTPAQLVVPAGVERCYAGTLGVNLFARLSMLGSWTEATGGTIPLGDSDYRVLDQSQRAARRAGQPLTGCLITLSASPED
ncbi:MAG: hypothetical protein AB7N53_02035 [Candidatus Binatia bacterium]